MQPVSSQRAGVADHRQERGTPAMHTTTASPRRRARTYLILLGLGLAFLAAGCRDSGPGVQVFTKQAGTPPLRLAVLPFSSPANAPGAGAVVTSTIITYLLATGQVDVVEPGLVEKAMRAARYAPESSAGLDPDMLGLLQQQLRVDGYMLGSVEEYGEVRVGPDSYPSVSFSARLLRSSDDSIIWAASISRTGADSVKLFDIGRVSSVGKLTKAAVAEMAGSLQRSAARFGTAAPGLRPVVTVPARPMGPVLHPVFQEEGKTYGVADLKALLLDVSGFSRGEVSHSRHAHDTVSALYSTDGGAIDASLVDYQQAAAAAESVRQGSRDLTEAKLGALAGYSGTSAHSGVAKLNVTLGRFGLYLSGPSSSAEKMRQLAAAIAADGAGK